MSRSIQKLLYPETSLSAELRVTSTQSEPSYNTMTADTILPITTRKSISLVLANTLLQNQNQVTNNNINFLNSHNN